MSSYPWASNFLAYAFPCCDCGVCYLTMPTLIIDGSETPYADLSTAQTALTDYAPGCIGEFSPWVGPGRTRGTYTASQNVTTKVVSFSDDQTGIIPEGTFLIAFKLDASGNVTVDYDMALTLSDSGAVTIELYQSDQTTLEDSDTVALGSSGGTGTLTVTVPDTSVYYLKVTYTAVATDGESTNTMIFSADINPPDADLNLCAVRAAWDDSGTTAYEAC